MINLACTHWCTITCVEAWSKDCGKATIAPGAQACDSNTTSAEEAAAIKVAKESMLEMNAAEEAATAQAIVDKAAILLKASEEAQPTLETQATEEIAEEEI